MDKKNLKNYDFIEIYELENRKYRGENLGIFKIKNKENWFYLNEKGNLSLTDEAWDDLENQGLILHEKSIAFDFISNKQLNDKIENDTKMFNFYKNRLKKLQILQENNQF